MTLGILGAVSRLRKLDIGRLSVLAILVLGTVALITRDQWTWLFSSDAAQTQEVAAPTIDDVDEVTERLYRISADNGSEVRYVVNETLAGADNTVTGVSSVVAGDIVIDTADPSLSRVGTIVVNVEMFRSDSNLRDKRIRHDFLSSTKFPFATFAPSDIIGMPTEFAEGASYPLTIEGDLTIKETTAPVTFSGSVSANPDQLQALVSSTVLTSTFGVGPIHIAGLVHTDDQITLEFDVVADRVDGPSAAPSADDLGRAVEVSAPVGGHFAELVQPILEKSCVSCHGAGGSGWTTVSINTAGEASDIAADIALVSRARYMPPWPASDLSVAFKHDWSLEQGDIDILAGWAESGGGLDIAPDTKLVARASGVQSLERDLVLLPDEPYVGSLDLPDDYRCQIIPVPDPEADGTWVSGFTFVPDKKEVVHHSIVFRAEGSELEAAKAMDEADPGAGWQCFGLTGLGEGVYPIAGWAPGKQPTVYPLGVGLHLDPGEFIINQIHYHFDDTTPPDSSAIILDTLTPDELAALPDDFVQIAGSTYLTPAEIPCTADEEGPLCSRSAALNEIRSKYGVIAPFIPDALIARCGGQLSDFDELTGTTSHSSCDLHLRNPGTIFSVFGHMHEIGSAYRMTLNPDTPEEKVLLDIPVWSFEWQFYYEPVEEIIVDRNDVVRFECTWDRSLGNFDQPRYVTWNEGTVDEMCFSSIQVIPAGWSRRKRQPGIISEASAVEPLVAAAHEIESGGVFVISGLQVGVCERSAVEGGLVPVAVAAIDIAPCAHVDVWLVV